MKHKMAWALGAAAAAGLSLAVRSRRKAESVKIAPEKVKAMLNSGKSMQLVDVREEPEFAEGHIPGAKLLPLGKIQEKALEEFPDKEALLLLYCRSGRRSAQAAQILTSMGYTHVYDVGGILHWPYELEKGLNGAQA